MTDALIAFMPYLVGILCVAATFAIWLMVRALLHGDDRKYHEQTVAFRNRQVLATIGRSTSNGTRVSSFQWVGLVIVPTVAAIILASGTYFKNTSPPPGPPTPTGTVTAPALTSVYTGNVFDAKTNQAIVGAKVRIYGLDVPTNRATDLNGSFSFSMRESKYVRIYVDATGYEPQNKNVNPVGDTESLNFLLDPSLPKVTPTKVSQPTASPVAYSQAVNKLTTTKIDLKQGNRVKIIATGSISVGDFVGTVGPDGKSSNLGFDLSQYCIVRKFPHAALLYRIGSTDEWKLCGSRADFIADSSGKLEFEVNDNDQSNNGKNDYFDLEIIVT